MQLSFEPTSHQRKRTAQFFDEDDDEPMSDPRLLARASFLKDSGDAHAEAGRFEEAMVAWKNALLIEPRNAQLHEQISQVHLELDQVGAAVQSAVDATIADPVWNIVRSITA